MIDWWSDNGPPVYISVAGYLGLIKKKKKTKTTKGDGNLNELFKLFPGGNIQ